MKIRIPLFTLLICICLGLLCSAEARGGTLDSLFQVVQQEKDPKKKADAQLSYLFKLFRQDSDSANHQLDMLIVSYKDSGFKYGLGRALSLKSWLLQFATRYEEALKLAHRAMAIQVTLNDSLGIAQTLNRIGLANIQFKRYDSGIEYLTRSLNYYKAVNDSAGIDMLLNNLGVTEANRKNQGSAISYYKQSLKIREARKDYFWIGYTYFNIGTSYIEMDQIDSAKLYLLTAYSTFTEKTPSGRVPPMVELGLGQLYNALGNYKEALIHVNKALKDATESDHTQLIIEGKIMAGDLLFKTGKYKEAYAVQQEYLELKNTVDSTNNAARVAEVEEQYKATEKEEEITRLKAEKLEAENRSQQIRLYALSAIVLLVIIAAMIIIYFMRKTQRQQVGQAALNAKITEAKLFALRAQMNPHFIFNSLNTAQGFVVGDQKEQAYEYISNFARLLRMVMENSSKTFVPLEDEVTQLELYIKLETIRFEGRFNYTLFIDPVLQNGIYEIPGMILQPFVENAIGHGLINRNDQHGQLTIIITLVSEYVHCEITDNGVGRQEAARIKAEKMHRYPSAAIPNIRERIELLKHQDHAGVGIEITDLTEDGHASGTRVLLTLPVR